jgi:hypothetical protein
MQTQHVRPRHSHPYSSSVETVMQFPFAIVSDLSHPPSLLETVSQWNVREERQSGSKVLESGSFKYGKASLAQNRMSSYGWRP